VKKISLGKLKETLSSYSNRFFATSLLLAACASSVAQEITLDHEHLNQVIKNHSHRLLSEELISSKASEIENNLSNANDQILQLAAVRERLYNSLRSVNEILKSGKQVKYLGILLNRIIALSSELYQTASQHPKYLIFTKNAAEYLKDQSLALAADINLLISNPEVLMEHSTRDQLLQDITFRMQIIAGSLSSMLNSLQFAHQKGFWRAINPFAKYTSKNKAIIREITRKTSLLK